MTKHFRKEHPTESIDQEDDAEYTDADVSEDEASLEQDAEDTPDSMEFGQEGNIKTELLHNAAASNYNANLWRLPAQTAQRSGMNQMHRGNDLRSEISAQTIKLERSMSCTPQRTLTDPNVNDQVTSAGYVQTRANTISEAVRRATPTSFPDWQSQEMQQSPASMSSPRDFQIQAINIPASTPPHYHQPQVISMSQPPLQPVHDIILEDPQQSPYTHQNQQTFPAMPTVQYTQPQHDFRDEMPRTPAPGQQITYLSSTDQGPHFLPLEQYPLNETYTLPLSQEINIYNDPDIYKEPKIEGTWGQFPEQTIRWF